MSDSREHLEEQKRDAEYAKQEDEKLLKLLRANCADLERAIGRDAWLAGVQKTKSELYDDIMDIVDINVKILRLEEAEEATDDEAKR